MDGTRFDVLTRRLSATSSRRGMLRGAAAAGLGLGLSRLGLGGAAAAAKKGNKRLCDSTAECKADLVCRKSNSQNGCFDKTEKRCCKQVGARCNSGCECCGVDVICNGHYCQKA